MAFKMKGHELPGPNQRKQAPTKWINFLISGISAIAGAAKKKKEADKKRIADANEKVKESTSGGDGADGPPKMADATKIEDATKIGKFEGMKT